MIPPFIFSRTPEVVFGTGRIGELPGRILACGTRLLLVTGGDSFTGSRPGKAFLAELTRRGIAYFHITVAGEPSPELIDEAADEFRGRYIEVVAAVGGGSVIDAGKALAAMLTVDESVMRFLDGVGDAVHPGTRKPLIAVPTTAGTGSEATRNAVISRVGERGFKKSLRHPNFVPDVALIDPGLAVNAPPDITAASGMDALTQLLESYVSGAASPLTDVLAETGLRHIKDNLADACTDEYADDPDVRGALAYAALLSGITLANAGLGAVHGLAGVIGGRYPARHGALCGALVAGATAVTIEKLKETEGIKCPALRKYARAGRILSGRPGTSIGEGCRLLTGLLDEWTRRLAIPGLAGQGVPADAYGTIAALADPRHNPGGLTPDDLRRILEYRPAV